MVVMGCAWKLHLGGVWEDCQCVVMCDGGQGSTLVLVLSIGGCRTILKRGLSCIQVRREYYHTTALPLVSILVPNSHLVNSQL